MSVWFITGASRGFGHLLTEAALGAGDQVVAAARNPQSINEAFPAASDNLLTVALDVTDEREARDAAAAAVARFGRIDVLVNNAGYGLFGAIEEFADDEARAVVDTNVFGLLNVTRAVLPTLREQGAGRLINISSSAGFAVGAGRGLYGASKFAVEAISEALRPEVEPLGILVTVVEPGSFRTEFLTSKSRRKPAKTIGAYDDTSGTLLSAIDQANGKQPGNPAKAVQAIRQLAATDAPPLRLQLGSDSVSLVESKLKFVAEELESWRELSLSTDFGPGE